MIQTLPVLESMYLMDPKLDQNCTPKRLKNPGLWSEPHPVLIGGLFRYSENTTKAAGD